MTFSQKKVGSPECATPHEFSVDADTHVLKKSLVGNRAVALTTDIQGSRGKNVEQRSPKQSKQGAQKKGLAQQNHHTKSHSFVNPRIAEMLQNMHKNSYVASIPAQSAKHTPTPSASMRTLDEPKRPKQLTIAKSSRNTSTRTLPNPLLHSPRQTLQCS